MHIEHLLEIGVAVIGTAALPSFAAETTLRGAFALPSMTEKATCRACCPGDRAAHTRVADRFHHMITEEAADALHQCCPP